MDNKIKMNIEIDYREYSVIEEFKKYPEINTTTKNLIVGDFIIKKGEDLLYVIERKSIQDLCSSITDNRYREQRQRLVESVGKEKVVYLIEGSKSNYKGKIPVKTINSALLNLIFKHQFKVVYTDSIQDTVENLVLLYNKINEIDNENLNETSSTIVPIKMIKKSESNTENKLLHQLSIIPGVSMNIAKIIVQENSQFKNIRDIVNIYNDFTENECENYFSEIYITTKRRLGKALSKKIYEYLCK